MIINLLLRIVYIHISYIMPKEWLKMYLSSLTRMLILCVQNTVSHQHEYMIKLSSHYYNIIWIPRTLMCLHVYKGISMVIYMSDIKIPIRSQIYGCSTPLRF